MGACSSRSLQPYYRRYPPLVPLAVDVHKLLARYYPSCHCLVGSVDNLRIRAGDDNVPVLMIFLERYLRTERNIMPVPRVARPHATRN
jgi:hypothetical protein